MIRLLMLVCVLASGAARAADPGANAGGGEGAGGGGCWRDAERLCPEAQRGSGRVADCLKGRVAELSETCKAAHPEWAAAQPPVPTKSPPAADPREDWRALCGQTFEKNCGALALPRIAACMNALPAAERNALAEPCRKHIKSFSPPAKKPHMKGKLRRPAEPASKKP